MASSLCTGLLVLLVMVLLVGICDASGEPWQHSAVLAADGSVRIKWSIHDGNFTCQIEADTLGWVGFGLSPNGGMKNSDQVVFGVKDGEPYINDMYTGNGYWTIGRDRRQDCHLLAGWETNGTTSVTFTRPLRPSCRPARYPDEDRDITGDTQHVLWAYHSEDPEEVTVPIKHQYRGQRSIHLLDPADPAPPSTNQEGDAVTWTIAQDNVSLPDESTVYWCRVVRAPELSRTHHVTRYRPVITPGNERVVHHMVMYQCSGRDFSSLEEQATRGDGYRCYSANMPPAAFACRGIIAGWGVGGGEFVFPEDVGYPMGPDDGGRFYILEVHYDLGALPDRGQPVVDSSGLEFTLTPALREQRASMLTVGSDVSQLQMVPPRVQEFVNVGHCSDECLDMAVPESGVTVFAALPHTHLLGHQIRVRHFRKGQELPMLLRDDAYDFNYQQLRHVTPRKVRRGDQLTVECVYNSNRDNVTLGGLSTQEEMCTVFLQYYPAMPLVNCVSTPIPGPVLQALDVTKVERQSRYGLGVVEPASMRGVALSDYVNQLNWTSERTQQLQKALVGVHVPECYTFGRRVLSTSRNTTEYPAGTEAQRLLARVTPCEGTKHGSKHSPDRSAGHAPVSMTTLPALFGATLLCMLCMR